MEQIVVENKWEGMEYPIRRKTRWMNVMRRQAFVSQSVRQFEKSQEIMDGWMDTSHHLRSFIGYQASWYFDLFHFSLVASLCVDNVTSVLKVWSDVYVYVSVLYRRRRPLQPSIRDDTCWPNHSIHAQWSDHRNSLCFISSRVYSWNILFCRYRNQPTRIISLIPSHLACIHRSVTATVSFPWSLSPFRSIPFRSIPFQFLLSLYMWSIPLSHQYRIFFTDHCCWLSECIYLLSDKVMYLLENDDGVRVCCSCGSVIGSIARKASK